MSNMPRLSAAQERTREWLEAQEEDDELESIAESSVVDSLDDYKYSEHTYTEQEDDDDDDDGEEVSTIALGTREGDSRGTIIRDTLRDLLNSINSIQTVGNVNISNSTNVHIGNVTNINGNIQIIAETTTNSAPRSTRNTHRVRRKVASPGPDNDEQHSSNVPDELDEAEERVNANVFISRQKFKIPKELCSIVPRHSWLAQMPMEEPAKLQLPVKYVVILHTATESSEKRAINVRLIRDIQCFHIESRGWNDIAYNFLIGCDGNIYEGRGWQAVGAHTLGYNRIALGVSFVGCFMRELPTQDALNMCRNLLARGVEDGYIDPDYRLICHCQCNSTESPGRMLFEEIQTWPHFYNIAQADDS
ncbi:peptidoglycan-recognition protein LE [Drosophila nasuta]|uniref:Peptidoglycan-recognition protein LE n=1 Tax=Drosophila albomicans TaxID=7291 RepID=A0A6P8XKG4_DROAB|nr:peptidoglycan-recognition protein LE [Drosophila albomicans]XP_034099127.1 peptidoglycan-recognition protein LE [Drosophila albomicans]XP_034099136.1 peptidoglycan-recognition protein LE [Drosophila albomicans]XP_060661809.1 peptidoglycan-recognition protein LE [Drosophila nasuta]XP_060661810.1 peptidoglycan-recognition protein LE [Drosophila nasuta]